MRLFAASVLLAALAAGAIGYWGWRELHRPGTAGSGEPAVFLVEPGESAGAILRRLEANGRIPSALAARAYLRWGLGAPVLKAGEYELGFGLSTVEILGKLQRGEIRTLAVTLVEGLDIDETLQALVAAGLGESGRLRAEFAAPGRISDLDPAADHLEGYLFPDTYRFAPGTPEKTIADTLVATFRRQYETRVRPLRAAGDLRPLRELVILASLVEKEAKLDSERPLIAAVYANRLRLGIGLYADPTIIHALKLLGRWNGNLTKSDLRMESPWNTYRVAGLPPGPICSAGLASLEAAARPADVSFLYFVGRNDGSHVFADTLDEHNRNVERWQKRPWRARSAAR
ncbi:MAG: endolytic transglycosylase MltG [Thermoanaerobaculia bacterium]